MRHRRDFDTAVRRGRRAGRRTLVVHAAATPSGDPSSADAVTAAVVGDGSALPARVGFIVSKAVGTAVVRNRVKRRLRAAARSRLPVLPPGALVVVRANPAAASASAVTLEADLDAAFARVLAGPGTRPGGRP
jgi:ribonuclease P protein component